MNLNFRRIFQSPSLSCLWLGQIISQSGDSIYQIGLLWLTLELSGSESITGLVAMSAYLPAVLLALFTGVAADRWNRKTIMLSADALRALLVIAVPLAFYFGCLNPLFLALNAFAIAIAAAFFNPARDSIIPQIVPRQGLLQANSLIQTSWQFSLLLGPAAAGLLLSLVGKINLFLAVSIAYFISFIFILGIKPKIDAVKVPRKGFGLTEIKEGLVYVIRQPVILPLLLITIADNIFIMGPAIVGAPVFVQEELGLGVREYAGIQFCYAVGMLIGTAGLLAVGDKFKKGQILLVGMVLDGITFAPLFFVKTYFAMVITIIVHSTAIPMLTVTRASLIQKIVPPNMTGRVFALVNMAVVGMSAVSAGITGFALEAVGARWVFMIIAVGGGLCGVFGWIWAKELKNTG